MSKANTHSVTEMIERLKKGDSLAEHQIWTRFFERLVRMADANLRHQPKRMGDGEDVVVNAFQSFLQGVENGVFPSLDDRNDLWQILLMLTTRRTQDHLRKEKALKRGDPLIVSNTTANSTDSSDSDVGRIDRVVGDEPTPQFACMCAEELQAAFDKLDSDQLVRIAQRKLQGYTNRDIAEEEGLSLRTIENRLSFIRKCLVSDEEA